ncbi:hypothetical protein [Stutzerimonas azotifigens]|uniref:hypothetical protein n=1 Tax=Stutzerimonas azotifigens TaxID=291995 RepID=UPI0004065642|nr:hypothetical protein [Stutzerimonas azotifigens]
MKSSVSRPWPALAFTLYALLLPTARADDRLAAQLREIERALDAGQLEQAQAQLEAARAQASPGDARFEQAQRTLADALIRLGGAALEAGDIDTAARALGQARSLMPGAPALTTGLEQSIEQMRQARFAVSNAVTTPDLVPVQEPSPPH